MAQKTDYYEILGVSKNATEDEIKSAFRKLSLKWHPDMQSGKSDEEKKHAEEKFKEIAEAYDVLSNKEKRERYDSYGFDDHQGFGGQDVDLGEFFRKHQEAFRHFFGGRGFDRYSGFGFGGAGSDDNVDDKDRSPSPGCDLQIDVGVSFKDSVFGSVEDIKYEYTADCDTCNGSGSADGKSVTCPACGGAGKHVHHTAWSMSMETCWKCHGTGRVVNNPCKKCGGRGRTKFTENFKLRVPPGVFTGAAMRIPKKGDGGRNGGARGDLNVYFTVADDETGTFTRARIGTENDIVVDLPVDPVTMMIGGTTKCPTLHGECDLKIPAMIKNNQLLKIAGQGILGPHGLGDLYARVCEVPLTNLTSKQKKLLEKLKGTIVETNNPQKEELMRNFGEWQKDTIKS